MLAAPEVLELKIYIYFKLKYGVQYSLTGYIRIFAPEILEFQNSNVV